MNTLGAEQFGSSLHLSVLAVSNTSLFYPDFGSQADGGQPGQQEKREVNTIAGRKVTSAYQENVGM